MDFVDFVVDFIVGGLFPRTLLVTILNINSNKSLKYN